MEVVIYKAKGKNGCLYDMSLNPCVDFEILKNTRSVEKIEVLTPRIPFEQGEKILKDIYGSSIFGKFVITQDYLIKRNLKRLGVGSIDKFVSTGIRISGTEAISKLESFITGKVVPIRRLFEIKDKLGLESEDIINIIQTLYCERRIRMMPAVRKKRGRNICSFCEKEACDDCCLGFDSEDVLLYAADNYNLGLPKNVGIKEKKLSDVLSSASSGITNYISNSKKNSAVLWCAPGAFDYTVLSNGLIYLIRRGGRILYITSPSLAYKTEYELSNNFNGVSISLLNNEVLDYRPSDITICSYTDYPGYHKAFDLVIYDERMSFMERPISNMISISSRAVKESGRFLIITCAPDFKKKVMLRSSSEYITIPIIYTKSPIPEPLIVTSRFLRENEPFMPSMVVDMIIWSIGDNSKVIVFVPDVETMNKIYYYLTEIEGIHRETIDFSTENDKGSLIKFKKGETTIIITSDFSDSIQVIEDVNVVVMNADSEIYKRDTLMYMAAMAAFHTRKKCGQVLFAVEKETEEVSLAKERIRGINKIAWEKGYLKK